MNRQKRKGNKEGVGEDIVIKPKRKTSLMCDRLMRKVETCAAISTNSAIYFLKKIVQMNYLWDTAKGFSQNYLIVKKKKDEKKSLHVVGWSSCLLLVNPKFEWNSFQECPPLPKMLAFDRPERSSLCPAFPVWVTEPRPI